MEKFLKIEGSIFLADDKKYLSSYYGSICYENYTIMPIMETCTLNIHYNT